MKKILVLFVILLFACSWQKPEPINANSLSEALQLAKELNRPVLIDFMTYW